MKVVVTLVVRRGRTRVRGWVVEWALEGPKICLDWVTRVVPLEQGEGE